MDTITDYRGQPMQLNWPWQIQNSMTQFMRWHPPLQKFVPHNYVAQPKQDWHREKA